MSRKLFVMVVLSAFIHPLVSYLNLAVGTIILICSLAVAVEAINSPQHMGVKAGALLHLIFGIAGYMAVMVLFYLEVKLTLLFIPALLGIGGLFLGRRIYKTLFATTRQAAA